MMLQDIGPRRASRKSGLGWHLAKEFHCCSQIALILQFALVEIVARHLRLSWETHCCAKESWVAEMDVGSNAGGVGDQGLLVLYRCLRGLTSLERVIVQRRNCLTFKIPSPIILFIPDSADLKQNWACLPFMWRGREGMPTSAWRLHTGVVL